MGSLEPGKDGDFVIWSGHPLSSYSRAEQTWIEGRRIFVYALRDIEEGEELTFDYGFDIECYEDHPCLCGAENCVGYIVIREQWPELKKRLSVEGRKTDQAAEGEQE